MRTGGEMCKYINMCVLFVIQEPFAKIKFIWRVRCNCWRTVVRSTFTSSCNSAKSPLKTWTDFCFSPIVKIREYLVSCRMRYVGVRHSEFESNITSSIVQTVVWWSIPWWKLCWERGRDGGGGEHKQLVNCWVTYLRDTTGTTLRYKFVRGDTSEVYVGRGGWWWKGE